MATKEPFESPEEQTAFGLKVEAARKWITGTACGMGYKESAFTVEFLPDSLTLRFTTKDPDFTDHFDRRLIEGIAQGDVTVVGEAYRKLQRIPPRRG